MPSFLFKADNRAGKPVTENIEAANLVAAREILETRGYVAIEFLNSELSSAMLEVYDPATKKSIERNPEIHLAAYEDSRLSRQLLRILKSSWYLLPVLGLVMIAGGAKAAFFLASFLILLLLYLVAPSIIVNRLFAAGLWRRSSKVRFWCNFAKICNRVSLHQIPTVEIDTQLACVDAAEGNVHVALARIDSYLNDPKIPPAVLRFQRIRVLSAGREYQKIAEFCEATAASGELSLEESIDYAFVLTVRLGKIDRAREVIEATMDRQMSVWERGFVAWIRGIIETEAESYEQAEFYLDDALVQFRPFRNNVNLDPLRYYIAFFHGVVYARTGRAVEALEKLEFARPYLAAIGDHKLAARCDELLAR